MLEIIESGFHMLKEGSVCASSFAEHPKNTLESLCSDCRLHQKNEYRSRIEIRRWLHMSREPPHVLSAVMSGSNTLLVIAGSATEQRENTIICEKKKKKHTSLCNMYGSKEGALQYNMSHTCWLVRAREGWFLSSTRFSAKLSTLFGSGRPESSTA